MVLIFVPFERRQKIAIASNYSTCQIAALQQAYDGLCMNRGTTALPYFLMKYTDDSVQMAPLGDWDTFFTDAKKVRHWSVLWL